MANYLERVASSAARRAAVAKPPSSGPPLLPAKDLSLPVEGSLPHREADSFEAADPGTPERRESPRSEKLPQVTPPAVNKTARTETPKPRHDAVAGVEPVAKPARAASSRQESLSSEAPFTVHLPKTLRPRGDSNIQAAVENEQPQPRRTPASIATKEIAAELSNVGEPHAAVPRSSDSIAELPATLADEESHVRPDKEAAQRVNEPRPEEVRHAVKQGPVQVVVPEPIPSDPDERLVQVPPPQHVSARNEPVPAAALPVQLPSPVAAGSQRRQEQSRVHIGSLEVTVNNHPPVIPARTARPTSLQNDQTNLERRYLDRFRLKR